MYVVGFDGGGSTARLAIATMDGKIIFCQEAKGVNIMDNPEWKIEYEKLFTAAEDYLKSVASACFGLPGWGEVPQLDRQVESFLYTYLSCPVEMMNDVELAHRAAFDDGLGILLLSGTGSMAIGRTRNRNFIRIGGFGHLIGDEGSAYWIGQQALMRLAQEIDGRVPKSTFGKELSRHLDCDFSLNGLMMWMDSGKHPRSHIASVSSIVDKLAELGNYVAENILIAAAKELFLSYQAICNQLDSRQEKHFWAILGSTFRSRTICRTIRDLIGYDNTVPAQSALDKALQIATRTLTPNA